MRIPRIGSTNRSVGPQCAVILVVSLCLAAVGGVAKAETAAG